MIESIPAPVRTVTLLGASNVFMTFAWYGHLKYLEQRPCVIAALVSWGMPSSNTASDARQPHRLRSRHEPGAAQDHAGSHHALHLRPFALFFMKRPLKRDVLWAGRCLVGAVYFVFRSE